MQTARVTINPQGLIHYAQPMRVHTTRQALVIFLDEGNHTALLAQPAQAGDWLRPEEDAAWAHWQPGN